MLRTGARGGGEGGGFGQDMDVHRMWVHGGSRSYEIFMSLSSFARIPSTTTATISISFLPLVRPFDSPRTHSLAGPIYRGCSAVSALYKFIIPAVPPPPPLSQPSRFNKCTLVARSFPSFADSFAWPTFVRCQRLVFSK